MHCHQPESSCCKQGKLFSLAQWLENHGKKIGVGGHIIFLPPDQGCVLPTALSNQSIKYHE